MFCFVGKKVLFTRQFTSAYSAGIMTYAKMFAQYSIVGIIKVTHKLLNKEISGSVCKVSNLY